MGGMGTCSSASPNFAAMVRFFLIGSLVSLDVQHVHCVRALVCESLLASGLQEVHIRAFSQVGGPLRAKLVGASVSWNVPLLQVLMNAGEPHEQIHARKIEPLVKRRHLLLVTLLITNAACLEVALL